MNVSEKDRKQDQIFLPPPLFFFPAKPFRGQFSQDDPIIILQRRLPPPNPMGGLSEGKTERKRKGNGGVVMVLGGGYTSGNRTTINAGQKDTGPGVKRHFGGVYLLHNSTKTGVIVVKPVGLKSKPDVASLNLELKERIMTKQLRGRFHGYNSIT